MERKEFLDVVRDSGILDDIDTLTGYWMYYDSPGGGTWEFDSPWVSSYKGAFTHEYAERIAEDGITYTYTGTDFYHDVIEEDYPEIAEAMSASEWTDIDWMGYGDVLVEDFGWKHHFRDNTYNWNHLGPGPVVFHVVEAPDGRVYGFYAVHITGDVRGNYTGEYVLDLDTYPEGMIEAISGSGTFTIHFKDGSELDFWSQQDSDVWYLESAVEQGGQDAEGLAAEWYPTLQEWAEDYSSWGFDEVIDELGYLVYDRDKE